MSQTLHSMPNTKLFNASSVSFLSSRFLTLITHYIFITTLSHYAYTITKDPLALGWIGLAAFLPRFLFTLPAGILADRYNRKYILVGARFAQLISACLLYLNLKWDLNFSWLYLNIFIQGLSYTFDSPASSSLLSLMVPQNQVKRFVSVNSIFFQLSSVLGPALGMFFYQFMVLNANPDLHSADHVAMMNTVILGIVLRLFSCGIALKLKYIHHTTTHVAFNLKSLFEGLSFVFKTKVLLGAMSLDLFAVLLGGSVAMLPIYASEILHVSPWVYGWLRAMPSIGAVVVSFVVSRFDLNVYEGKTFFASVIIFGIFTLVFALSKSVGLSCLALFVMGGSDVVSVIFRGALLQTTTPLELRGRVSAVSMVFIGASNELGEFESGLTASWFGVIPATVIGGVGTIVVSLWHAKYFRSLWEFGHKSNTT